MQRKRLVRVLAALAVASTVFFGVVVLALHVLNPEFSPVSAFISQYANGPYGTLASVSFFVQGLGLILLGVSLCLGVSRPGRSTVGLVILFVSGVNGLLYGVFPMDPAAHAPTTLSGTIHYWAGMFDFTLGVLYPFLLSHRFARDWRMADIHASALGLGIAVLVVSAVGWIVFAVGIAVDGLTQRTLTVLMSSWVLLVGIQLATAPKYGSE